MSISNVLNSEPTIEANPNNSSVAIERQESRSADNRRHFVSQHERKCYNDRALADRCVNGEVSAWEDLYQAFGEPLTNLVRYLLGPKSVDVSLVDEISSRVWLSLIAEDGAVLDRYDPSRGARLITYLRLLVRDEIKRHFRSELRRRRRDEIAGAQPRSGVFSDAMLESSLVEFTEQLTPREKTFFTDYLISQPENEDDPNRPSDANIWQLRHRIRRKLAKFLEDA